MIDLYRLSYTPFTISGPISFQSGNIAWYGIILLILTMWHPNNPTMHYDKSSRYNWGFLAHSCQILCKIHQKFPTTYRSQKACQLPFKSNSNHRLLSQTYFIKIYSQSHGNVCQFKPLHFNQKSPTTMHISLCIYILCVYFQFSVNILWVKRMNNHTESIMGKRCEQWDDHLLFGDRLGSLMAPASV